MIRQRGKDFNVADKIRWGILGTGGIARKFATGLSVLDDAELVAVGSRTQESADRFAEEFGVGRCHPSCGALAADDDVDVVYIATPHPMHLENSIACLEKGRHVLCEKPITLNVHDTEKMIAVARRENRFLMEAMWMRFIPTILKIEQWLADGAIGDVCAVEASFGFCATPDPAGRWFNPALGGGALLDVGIYPISFASVVFGRQPDTIVSQVHLGDTSVDEQNALLFQYEGGAVAQLSSAVRTEFRNDAVIFGTEGMIKVDAPFWNSETVTLVRSGQPEERCNLPIEGNGYNYEAQAVMQCIRDGRLEEPRMPHAESLAIMQTLDALRQQWGLRYPGE